jgi:hypothetical protein
VFERLKGSQLAFIVVAAHVSGKIHKCARMLQDFGAFVGEKHIGREARKLGPRKRRTEGGTPFKERNIRQVGGIGKR